jgi:hypothetical protein
MEGKILQFDDANLSPDIFFLNADNHPATLY